MNERIEAAFRVARGYPPELARELLDLKPHHVPRLDPLAWLATCALLSTNSPRGESAHDVARRLASYVTVYTERYGTPPSVTPKRMDKTL